MNKLLLLALCLMIGGCGIVIIDSTSDGKGGGTGGEAGADTSSSSGGSGGSETTSPSGGTGGETSTSSGGGLGGTTTTGTCDPGPKECQEGTCFCPADHVCCDKETNPNMCIGNDNGYCCPVDMFCIPKG